MFCSKLINSCIDTLSKEKVVINDCHYYINKTIAQTNLSCVYLALSGSTQEVYAIKRITATNNTAKQRAMKEVDLLMKLRKHPHVIKLFDFAVNPSTLNGAEDILLLLEYYPRGSLEDYIKGLQEEEDSLSEENAIQIFIGVCSAIRELHHMEPPVVHRDIKPSNVLIGINNFHPVLIDFGSCESVDNLKVDSKGKKSKQQIEYDCHETSTFSYRPPEIFDLGGVLGEYEVDERVDIWSLGCLLYCMAYHINPFDEHVLRGGSVKLAVQGGADNIKWPKNNRYSDGFKQIIIDTLQVDPKKRPKIDQLIENSEKVLRKIATEIDISFD